MTQGEDNSLKHVDSSFLDRFNFTADEWRHYIEDLSDNTVKKIESMISDESKESIMKASFPPQRPGTLLISCFQSLHSMEDYANQTYESLSDTVSKSRMGPTLEQWVTAARVKINDAVHGFYQKYPDIPLPESMKQHIAEKEREQPVEQHVLKGRLAMPLIWPAQGCQ